MDKKTRILVVDDSPADIELTARALRQFVESDHLLVDYALDGKKALELIKSGDYNIVFLDIAMQELTGFDVLDYVKDNNIKTKVIFLTGYSCINEHFAKKIRADEYLEKPIDQKAIAEIIDKYGSSS